MTDNIDGHKLIVFCVDHYNPLGLIRSLGEGGVKPIVIIVSDAPYLVTSSKYCGIVHTVSNIEDGYNLLISKYADKNNKPVVFTASDDIERYLDEHYNSIKESIIFFDGGEEGKIARFMDKHEIMLAAQKVGLRIPTAQVLEKGQLPTNVPYPVITKSIASTVGGWKNDVFICNNEEELLNAYKVIKSPMVLVEEYITKSNELCLDGISFDGGKQVYMPLKCNYLRFSNKAYGNYMMMSPFKDQELHERITQLFRETGFSGIFSIEFLVTQNNELVFLEINFRNSTWSYSSTYAGANLPIIWANSVIKNKKDFRPIKETPFTAMAELSDFAENVPSGKVNLFKWLWDFHRCPCPFIYNKQDKKPFFALVKHLTVGKLTRKH